MRDGAADELHTTCNLIGRFSVLKTSARLHGTIWWSKLKENSRLYR
jgi:hypothetical protein